MPYTLFCFTLQGIHLCNRTKIVALLPEIGDHIGQGLDGLTCCFCIMQQDDTGVLTIGIAANVAQNLRGIRVAGGGVLGADVPVDPVVALVLGLGLQGLHDAVSAVAVADRVGAAAWETQPVDGRHIHIRLQRLAQRSDVLPECVGARINFGVLMRRAVQRDLMPRRRDVRHKGQIFFVGVLRADKEGGRDLLLIENFQNWPGVFAGAVVKGQADDFGQRRLPRRRRHRKAVVGGVGLGVLPVVQLVNDAA